MAFGPTNPADVEIELTSAGNLAFVTSFTCKGQIPNSKGNVCRMGHKVATSHTTAALSLSLESQEDIKATASLLQAAFAIVKEAKPSATGVRVAADEYEAFKRFQAMQRATTAVVKNTAAPATQIANRKAAQAAVNGKSAAAVVDDGLGDLDLS